MQPTHGPGEGGGGHGGTGSSVHACGHQAAVRVLRERLDREQAVVRAMQARLRKWHGPVLSVLWSKPWKSPAPLGVSFKYPLSVSFMNFYHWLTLAHDCKDPSVGCSCSGGYRYPEVK